MIREKCTERARKMQCQPQGEVVWNCTQFPSKGMQTIRVSLFPFRGHNELKKLPQSILLTSPVSCATGNHVCPLRFRPSWPVGLSWSCYLRRYGCRLSTLFFFVDFFQRYLTNYLCCHCSHGTSWNSVLLQVVNIAEEGHLKGRGSSRHY